MTVYISDATYEALAQAAIAAQARLEHEEGEHYAAADLQRAFLQWLESCIEQLAEEAMYHAFEGHDSYAFNRSAFRDRLNKLTPAFTPQEADESIAA